MPDFKEYYAILKSHLRPTTQITSTQSNINSAIQKMTFLDDAQFGELLSDLTDELLRRKNNVKLPLSKLQSASTKRNLSRKKLSYLTDEKIEFLIIDCLLVLKHRYNVNEDELKSDDDISSLIGDLEKLIKDMKGDMKYETSIINQIRNERSSKFKLHIYNKYVKRMLEKHNEDVVVVNFMEALNIEEDKILFEDMIDPHIFLKHSEAFISGPDNEKEFEYHKENILALFNETSFSDAVKSSLIRKEMINIFDLALKQKRNDKGIEKEVNEIIKSLALTRELMDSDKEMCLEIGNSVVTTVDNILSKINMDAKDTHKLCEQKNLLKEVLEQKRYDDVALRIFGIAKIIKILLCYLPVN